MSVLLLLGLLAGADDYQADVRQAQLLRAIEAVSATSLEDLANAINYVAAMDRNVCGSDFRRLRVQCLIEEAAKNCRGMREAERRRRCTSYFDIIVTNVLAEKTIVSEEQRYKLMQSNSDFRTALRRELSSWYGHLAADFRLSPTYACTGAKAADASCIARAIDEYCLDQPDRQSLSWQHCASALVWFIGTAAREGGSP